MRKLFLSLLVLLVTAFSGSAALITTTGTKPSKGNGNKNSPYEITNAEELRWFVHYENTRWWFPDDHAKLMNDIDLSSVCGPTKGSWIPLGYAEESGALGCYKGKFDGNGYRITNLYINGEDFHSSAKIGFIGNSGDIKIYRLTVEGEIKNTTSYTGGIIGFNRSDNGVVEYCVSKVKFTGTANTSHEIGGVVGRLDYARTYIDHCIYDGDMSELTGVGQRVGGLVGYFALGQYTGYPVNYCVSNTRCEVPLIGVFSQGSYMTSELNHCVSNHKIFNMLTIDEETGRGEPMKLNNLLYCASSPYELRIFRNGHEPIVTNCVKIETADLASGKACYDINQNAEEKFCQDIDYSPEYAPYPPQVYNHWRVNRTVYQNKTYTDCTNYDVSYSNTSSENTENRHHVYNAGDPYCTVCHNSFNSGYEIGKDGEYYLLSKANDLRYFWALVNDNLVTDAKARITADIEMDEGSLSPLNVFKGEIDGQGHELSNLNITSFEVCVGLVGTLQSGGSIHDLTISGSILGTNSSYVGGFCGKVESGASLYNLRNDCSVNFKNYKYFYDYAYLGGIAGWVNGSISKCINNGSVIYSSSWQVNAPTLIAGVAGYITSSATFSHLVNNASVGSDYNYSSYSSAVANHSAASPTGLYYVKTDCPGHSYSYSDKASSGATVITDRKDVGSGKLCYLLNSPNDDESQYFGQTIGTDYVPYPYVNESHKRVYNTKRYYNCTNFYEYSNLSYDDTPVDTHVYNSDGYCTLCYHADVPQEDEIYQISTAEQWNKYAKAINAAYSNGALGCFASCALTADITLNASDFTTIGNLWGNINGNGHTVTFSNDPGTAYTLINNVGSTAAISNLNVHFTGTSNGIINDNKGKVTECMASDGQIYTLNYGVVTDCYADGAFGIAGNGVGTLVRCLQCTGTPEKKVYTVLSKTKGTAECSVNAEFTQEQAESGELAYYISHMDDTQPCVWGQELGTDSHPKPCMGQTKNSDTYVTRLTSYSAEYPAGKVEYMNAGMVLEPAPGYYKVCEDTESWTTHPAYNFIVDNGDGTYSAEHINIDPTAQHYLPIEVQAEELTIQSVNDNGELVSRNYDTGDIVSLVLPIEISANSINGIIYLFDGYDADNNILLFTSSTDYDLVVPANTPFLVKAFAGSILTEALTDVLMEPMTESNFSEREKVRHLAGYQQQELPCGRGMEDGEYVLYYVQNGDKATLAAEDALTAIQFGSYFRLPWSSVAETQDEIKVVLADSRQLMTSRILERDIFSIPYGRLSEDAEWEKVSHLNDSGHPNIFFGNEIANDIYANISAYDFLYIYGTPGQKYYFYFNGTEPTEITVDEDGDGFVELNDYRVGIGDIYLHGIRVSEGETLADNAYARVYKDLDDGLMLYGYGEFADELKGYPFYDATGVECAITFNLDNPNAIVVGGSNVKGVYNRIEKSADVMQGFTADALRLTDGGDFCYDYSVKCPKVTFTRYDIPEEVRYVTFVLPFAVYAEVGMHEYIDCDGSNVYFNTPADGVIDAYLPIVIDMKEYGERTVTIEGENFVALSPNGVFNVTPAPSTQYDMRFGFVTRRQENTPVDNEELREYNLYGFSSKSYKFVRFVDTFSIDPFRAFFMLPKSSMARINGFGSAEVEFEALDIILDGVEIGDVDGIDNVIVDTESGDGVTYNLLGIPVSPGYRGIAIRNGKKIIIK